MPLRVLGIEKALADTERGRSKSALRCSVLTSLAYRLVSLTAKIRTFVMSLH